MKIIITTLKGKHIKFDNAVRIDAPRRVGEEETKVFRVELSDGSLRIYPQNVIMEVEIHEK